MTCLLLTPPAAADAAPQYEDSAASIVLENMIDRLSKLNRIRFVNVFDPRHGYNAHNADGLFPVILSGHIESSG